VASVSLTCEHDADTLCRGLNAQLPGDVRVMTVEDAPADFHARFSARSKTYRYLIRNGPLVSPFEHGYVWHVSETLDLDAMRAAARSLEGTHDFAAFRSAGSHTETTVRTLWQSTVVEAPDDTLFAFPSRGRLLACEVRGDGFLRHMVRAIVGTVVEVGRGWREPASVPGLLDSAARAEAGATAPAHGLYLVSVDYH
jgi:tRNA pseudouridine38-40 synthase